MPLLRQEEFVAMLQKNNRIQVPVLIRWKHKLGAGEVLRVYVRTVSVPSESQSFYARLSKDGRFTVPWIVVKKLEVEPREMLKVTLYAEEKE